MDVCYGFMIAAIGRHVTVSYYYQKVFSSESQKRPLLLRKGSANTLGNGSIAVT
jgi:hypothetical protein